jgi:hypothetical protein
MKTYYKACHHTYDDKYISAVNKEGDWCVEYKIDKWVRPNINGTNLMVFDSLEKARDCINKNRWYDIKIFECNVEKPSKKGLFSNPCLPHIMLVALKQRLARKKYRHLTGGFVPPIGTIFCTAVKLIKEVI